MRKKFYNPQGEEQDIEVLFASPGTHEHPFMKPRGRFADCLPYSIPSIDALSVNFYKTSLCSFVGTGKSTKLGS